MQKINNGIDLKKDIDDFIDARIEAGFSKAGGWKNEQYRALQDRHTIIMNKLSETLSEALYEELKDVVSSVERFYTEAFYQQGFLDGFELHNSVSAMLIPWETKKRADDLREAFKNWVTKEAK